jgi:hypothetical protein
MIKSIDNKGRSEGRKVIEVTTEVHEKNGKIGAMKSHKGTGITECLILIIVLGLAVSAIFSTLCWSVKSYTFARQEMKGRELLFGWVQAFESLWPAADASSPEDAFEKVAGILNGTWDNSNKLTCVDGFIIVPRAKTETAGSQVVDLKIYGGSDTKSKLIVDLTRSYNVFSSETVSDNSLL